LGILKYREILKNFFDSTQVKNLFQSKYIVVCSAGLGSFKERPHLSLPPFVYPLFLHVQEGLAKIWSLEITDEQTVLPGKQRVILPARIAKRVHHLRPYLRVALFILIKFLGSDLQQEAHSFHIHILHP
jgi:hypothetical protein